MDNTPMDRPNIFIKTTFYLCMLCIFPVAAENLNMDKAIAEELTEKQTIDPIPDTTEQKQEQKKELEQESIKPESVAIETLPKPTEAIPIVDTQKEITPNLIESKPIDSKPISSNPINNKSIITQPSTTSSMFDVIQLEDHANNKEYQQGYELSKKILPDWEGDPTFDFLYGMHAIETGHYDEATFAFERLTLLNPKTLRYRLELARALYFNNNLDTAKTEFEIALASQPPENVKKNINDFLQKINKSKEKASHNWGLGAGLNMGFDSNINSGTEEDGVDIPSIGFVSLQKEAQSQSSSFTQFSTQGIYSYSHKKHHSLDASFNTNHKRNNEISTYDLDVINLSGNYSWQPYKNLRLQGGLTNTNVSLDSKAYQNQNTLNAMALYTRQNGFSFSTNLSIGSRTAKSENAPDADISLLALSMIWPSSSIKSTNLSLYSSTDDVSDSQLSHFGKSSSGINFGTKLLLTSNIVRSMVISVSSTEYQAPDPNFLEVRKDNSFMGAWGYAWSASKFMTISSNLVISHNSSNLDLFTSYRAIFNTGLNVNF